ncbi:MULTISPECIES: hypothetical protein [unclassified Pseudomonas]|uniref:hypothetical protein n=1 Tax=unclassified Pseudomonas TaxID=196821 RepID=UPI00384CBC45
MNSKKTVSMFFSIAFVGAFAQAVSAAPSQQGALSFHGQLVNAGCEARVLDVSAQRDQPKSIRVNAHVTVGLVVHDDACEGATVPVSTAYVEQTSIETGVHNGVVTLTYQ